jgi:hypothetical protein
MSTSPERSPLPTAWATIGFGTIARVTRSKKTGALRDIVLLMAKRQGLLLPNPNDDDLL